MNLQEAVIVLKEHNGWRQGKHDRATHPKELTEALEIAITLLEPMISKPCSCAHGFKKKNENKCAICLGSWSDRIKSGLKQ